MRVDYIGIILLYFSIANTVFRKSVASIIIDYSRACDVYTLYRLRPVRGSFDPSDTRSITRGERFENGVSRQSCDVCLAVRPGSTRLFISII